MVCSGRGTCPAWLRGLGSAANNAIRSAMSRLLLFAVLLLLLSACGAEVPRSTLAPPPDFWTDKTPLPPEDSETEAAIARAMAGLPPQAVPPVRETMPSQASSRIGEGIPILDGHPDAQDTAPPVRPPSKGTGKATVPAGGV